MKQSLFLDTGLEKLDKKDMVAETKNTNFQTLHFIVSKENKKQVKRAVGDYFVMRFTYEKLYEKPVILEKELIRILKSFIKKYQKVDKVLIVGLGNQEVLADSFGIEVTNQVMATNHYQDFLTIPKIALFNPSVTEKTGINSYKLIEMVVHDLKPDLIIMIDSLATSHEDYLNSAIEINNTGIIPGSALNGAREINEQSFHIPIISIGLPCCFVFHHHIYTSTNIKDIISWSADIVAKALNQIFIEHH